MSDSRAADDGRLFSGLRVVEAATMVMVPSAAAVLADFGADVVKIEPPGGDLNRRGHLIPGMPSSEYEYCFLQDNRNKRSVVLDLKSEPGRTAMGRLLDGADVFMTNYRQTALERLGLDSATLRERHPRLVYAHGTGYGERGPEAARPGFDSVCYWSRSALEATMFPLDGWLGPVGYGTGDHPSGMALFGAIVAALYRRERTGRGSRVHTSLLANGAWSNSTTIQARLVDARFHDRRPREQSLNFAAVYYRARDDRIFKFTIVDHAGTWPRLCRAVGLDDWVDDPRYSSVEARADRMSEIVERLDRTFATADLEHWRAAFAANDVPFSPLSTYDDVVDDPQMRESGVFVDYSHPEIGTLSSVDSPIHIADEPKVPPRPAPALGQHTREVLRELGLEPPTGEGEPHR